jgi:dihydroorotate dehydrogenase (NAD+) catalytic subunit
LKEVFEEILKTEFRSINLTSPFLPASGTFGYGYEALDLGCSEYFGAIITKGLSLKPREGNTPPRIREVPCGLINSIGLENPGLEEFKSKVLPNINKIGKPVFVNLAGHDIEEFVLLIEELNCEPAIVGYEINISCPNVSMGGLEFFYNKEVLRELLREIKRTSKKINIVKIPPDIFHYNELVSILVEEGFDILTVANTYPSLYVDVENLNFYFDRKFGGLSGPSIFPLTLRLVYLIKKQFPMVNVIASGGIYSAEIALQYFMCGANLIEIGSASFTNPCIVKDIYKGVGEYLIRKGFNSLKDIIGLLLQRV